MKKRMIVLALLVLTLTGCGRQDQMVPDRHFSVLRQETEIALDAPAAPVLEVLGAPFSYAEAKRSSRNGVEKTYHFAGLNLQTYPTEEGDRIRLIQITDGSLQTAEGISVGSTAAEVRACYGEDALNNGCCTVSNVSETMTLLVKNNVVTEIWYQMM